MSKIKMGRKDMRPILFIAGIYLILFVSCGICGIGNDYIRQANEYMRSGKYREAIVYFEAARSAEPENQNIKVQLSYAYHNLALQKAAAEDWSQAISNEQQALKYSPDNETIKKQLSIFYNNYGLEWEEKEKFELAIQNIKSAIQYAPDSGVIKENLYNIILKYADFSFKEKNYYKAMGLINEAISLFPNKAGAYIIEGNINYQQDNFTQALASWNKALEIDPQNDELRSRIDKTKREGRVEAGFDSRNREHFKIRFENEIDSEYVWTILDILEDARRKLRNEYGMYSDETIPVIVYTKEKFGQATQASDWTAGLYDGKIRIKQQDISKDDAILRKVIYHEYTHAILYLSYGLNIPIWLQEGFAQINEPQQILSDADKNFLRSYMKEYGEFFLKGIDAIFGEKNSIEAQRAAYLESKLFVQFIIEKYRQGTITSLLERLKEGKAWDISMSEVYGKTLARFDEEFNEYLEQVLI